MGSNVRSKERQAAIDKYLSKENLEQYLPQYSANYIAKKLFLPDFTSDANEVIKRAKRFGVPTHSIRESCFLSHVKESKRQKCQEKYGVDNPSQAQEIKDKKEQAALDRYGVINVFQAEEIKQKSRETCLEKYGTEYVAHIASFKSVGKRSKFHRQIEDILDKNHINYKSEVGCLCKAHNEYYDRIYSPIVDLYLFDNNIIIECYGDFWHANPTQYQASDTFDTFEGRKEAQEIWIKDRAREKQITDAGYILLVIWEAELKHNKQAVEQKILNAINQDQAS